MVAGGWPESDVIDERRRDEAPWVRSAILAGKPFHYRRLPAWAHNALNLGALVGVLGVVAVTLALGRGATPWPYVPAAGVVFGWCYFALIVLVVHEASHGMFVVARGREARRRWNRVFGRIFTVPFVIDYVRHWEEGHVIHHRIPIEPGDPQALNRLTGVELLRDVAILVLVPGSVLVHRFLTRRAKSRRSASRWTFPAFAVFWVVIGAAVWHWISGAALLALLYGLQILSAVNQVKGSLEHGGPIAFDRNPYLRSRTSLFPGRRLLLPFNITLHFEHHLNDAVPWYALLRYQRALRAIVPRELHGEVWNHDLWAQLCGRKGALPAVSTRSGE